MIASTFLRELRTQRQALGGMAEFSQRGRPGQIDRLAKEEFDFLVLGGGITGAAVARELVSQGYSAALIEQNDFASGTSSRSSKLIHGGLRYLENLEFGLVFEALSERSILLKTAPNLIRPLPFLFPVYRGDRVGKNVLDLGLWLYDLLTLFRTPAMHKRLSRNAMLTEVPFLRAENLEGGFRYYDASMWDDVYVVDILRNATRHGAFAMNYVRAQAPIWDGRGRLRGFHCADRPSGREFNVRARSVIWCAGPWTDLVGEMVRPREWEPVLEPSRGVHLVFDWKRIPVPGAVVMNEAKDGRISFVMPRPDLGAGVTIVGTTDGPSPRDPAQVEIQREDVDYLLGMLARYFPQLKLTAADVLSGYVGVRPLFKAAAGASLQKVSREHHIDTGPGESVVVTGGKYTTHRKMAEEIVEYALRNSWDGPGKMIRRFRTQEPVNLLATPERQRMAREWCRKKGFEIPETIWSRYGADALSVADFQFAAFGDDRASDDPAAFEWMRGRMQYALRYEKILHLEDFYLRRQPLFATRADHGLPWAEPLAKELSQALQAWSIPVGDEAAELRERIRALENWKNKL